MALPDWRVFARFGVVKATASTPSCRVRPSGGRTPIASAVCIERGFGKAQARVGVAALAVRRIDRVRLHVDLTMLAQLASALADARARSSPAPPHRHPGYSLVLDTGFFSRSRSVKRGGRNGVGGREGFVALPFRVWTPI